MLMFNLNQKLDRINTVLFIIYGLLGLIDLFYLSSYLKILMVFNLIIALTTLYLMNQQMKQDPIVYRSPMYYLSFFFFTMITIWISGGFHSLLFPYLYLFPVLYVSVNFPRKGSTGIGILTVATLWLILLQDPSQEKFEQTVIATILVIAIPQIVGYMVKEYILHMRARKS